MVGWSQDSGVGGCRVHVSSQLGHLPGAGGGLWTPKGTGGTSTWAGRTLRGRGEEKWRQDGTSAPEGWLGEGRGSYAQRGPITVGGSVGMGRDLWRIGELQENMASISPTHLGLSEPAGAPGLNLCPPGPPPAVLCLSPTPHTLPRPFLAFFFCCGSVLPCCYCFIYIYIFSNLFFILILFYFLNFLFFVIVLLLFVCCLFFFFLFLPHHMVCGILVPRPEVGPELLWWQCWVQTSGLTENLRSQGVLIGVRSPRGPRLSIKTQLYPTACKLQCWMPQAKQTVGQEHSLTHQKTNEMTK